MMLWRSTLGAIALCVGLFVIFSLALLVARAAMGPDARLRAVLFWALVSTAVIWAAMRASLLLLLRHIRTREQRILSEPNDGI